MSPRNQSILDRRLNSEERQYLRDLGQHQGFQLLVQAIQERMAQSLNIVLYSGDMKEVFNSQGRYLEAYEILGLPRKLTEVPDSPINTQQRPVL